jgi:hypothetical protein
VKLFVTITVALRATNGVSLEPGEILNTVAQIAVALAGFAGVVVVGVGTILLELYNAALLGYAKFFSRSHDAPVSI